MPKSASLPRPDDILEEAPISRQSRKKPSTPTRFSLLLDDNAVETLDHLMDDLGLRNKAAVFDMSLALLAWANKEIRSGNRIGKAIGESNTFQQVHFMTPTGKMM